MKKRIMLISSVLLTLSIILVVTINNMDNKEKNIISNTEKEKQVINSNMITMMYETDAGTGIYEETKDNTWPESGYIFNSTLSGCENGGELEYNSENNTVNLLSNKSDRCYVYFDKYDGVWIDNVVATNITGSSITLDISATSENGSITKYYYSLNDSEEYQEVTSNVITINDLNKLTEYKISIYAIDNTNAKSNIYELSVSTTDESGPVINFALINEITSDSISLTLQVESKNKISNYYYSSNGGISYVSNNSNTYTFSGLNKNTQYNISIYVEDNTGQKSNTYTFKITTENILTLAEYIKSLYTSQGSNGIYYHISSLSNSAKDNSYRYAGANPNNYVCFGTDSNSCPETNLYRIIGVFGSEVKLIKADYTMTSQTGDNYAYINSYENWLIEGADDYDGGLLFSDIATYNWNNNLFNYNINNIFLNSYDIKWRNKISTHAWKKNGIDYTRVLDATPNQTYNYEIGANSSSTTYSAKMGLMYVSDYGFAATPNFWTKTLGYDWLNNNGYDTAKNDNWMYVGLNEWTISYRSDGGSAFDITNNGSVNYYTMERENYGMPIRPCFYLTSSTTYVSGSGTSSDPIRIN